MNRFAVAVTFAAPVFGRSAVKELGVIDTDGPQEIVYSEYDPQLNTKLSRLRTAVDPS